MTELLTREGLDELEATVRNEAKKQNWPTSLNAYSALCLIATAREAWAERDSWEEKYWGEFGVSQARRICEERAETALAEAQERQRTLFGAIKHGDQEHMDWLCKAIEDHFAGREVERPRGKGTAEALAEAREQNERLREQITWLEKNSRMKTPASATIMDYLHLKTRGEWETPCPAREDKQHCNCWYDGNACCDCGDAALSQNTEEDGDG